MSNVCPFCNSALSVARAPCPSCGRQASAAPAGAGHAGESGWDDDELGGGLDFSRGGSTTSHSAGPSAYSGGGLSLGDDDDPFAEDAPQGSLELDLPPSHTANSSRSMPAAKEPTPSGSVPDLQVSPKMPALGPPPAVSAPPRSGPSTVAVTSPPPDAPSSVTFRSQGEPSLPPRSVPQAPADPPLPAPPPRTPDPAALIARYPAAPAKVWEAPVYAMKVLWRQMELRQDLAALRKKRSPDVPLYERALVTHDAKTFALGLVITLAGFAVASFVFFLPVILRFLRDPD